MLPLLTFFENARTSESHIKEVRVEGIIAEKMERMYSLEPKYCVQIIPRELSPVKFLIYYTAGNLTKLADMK